MDPFLGLDWTTSTASILISIQHGSITRTICRHWHHILQWTTFYSQPSTPISFYRPSMAQNRPSIAKLYLNSNHCSSEVITRTKRACFDFSLMISFPFSTKMVLFVYLSHGCFGYSKLKIVLSFSIINSNCYFHCGYCRGLSVCVCLAIAQNCQTHTHTHTYISLWKTLYYYY